MKNTVYLIKTLLLSLLLIGCVEEKSENYDFIQTISDPQNISAEIYVDENTGAVSVTPMGEGVVLYEINFGDESAENESVDPGESVDYSYLVEGIYTITIYGFGLNGSVVEASYEVDIPYIIPESLIIQNFEDGVSLSTFSFGGASSGIIITNPDPSGENTTENVLEFNKSEGAEVWAGMGFTIDVLEFNDQTSFQLKSYSPEVGKVIKVKLETVQGNVAGLTHEVDVVTTVANEWETLVYDFSAAPDLEYVSFIVFYDFGNTAGGTYRLDEIQLID
ncbi:MAG: hypothetical protein ACJ0PA_06115 [Flavobacteriaceae bacterium]|tara:strand:- start:3487 stop:4317 length:831 start_codon:yes stop_codon:yes gene_type:complete